MRGVYLVAAELARQGFIASPISRSARGADLLVTSNDCKRAFTVEVKKVSNANYFQLAPHAKSMTARSYVYVFVHIKESKRDNRSKRKTKSEGIEISYYPVTSRFVAKNVHYPGEYRTGWSIWRNKIEKFKNKWNIFGRSGANGKSPRVSRH
jgi:hypothetical protein